MGNLGVAIPSGERQAASVLAVDLAAVRDNYPRLKARVGLGISMDSLIVDVTALPEEAIMPGTIVEVIGSRQTVDDLAAAMSTIGYEVLTSLAIASRGSIAMPLPDASLPQLSEGFVS